jgi:hypothetical protein
MATTIACEALLLALYMWPVRRTMIGVAKTSWRALLPSGVLAAVLVTPVPLALSTGLGIAAWSAAAWSVGGVTRADLKRLRRL